MAHTHLFGASEHTGVGPKPRRPALETTTPDRSRGHRRAVAKNPPTTDPERLPVVLIPLAPDGVNHNRQPRDCLGRRT